MDTNDVEASHRDAAEEAHAVAAWLREQPAGTISWGDDHVLLVEGARRVSWVDVVIPDACTALGVNWVWTIVGPDDEDAADAWPAAPSTTIVCEPDCVLLTVWDPKTGWYADGFRVTVARTDVGFTDEQITAAHAYAATIDGTVDAVLGWRNATLSSRLAEWTRSMSGRPDLAFTFDPAIRSVRARHFDDLVASSLAMDAD